ncbi:MFS general substrate transporter [Choiromyces venosus 120613-1]|uniref:MFS general substrate transporter n=1 Tax=Choiromyces venosus 120613-1 TaxID=1336337 RepID=A0A3N4JCQ2_9PEZI|nr:MFS general substrate transporter [Choiromyces venosus 120613-1]
MAPSKNSTPLLQINSNSSSQSDLSIESLDIIPDGNIDPVYQAKAKILNKAMQDIGMGKYQWGLFIVAGFGWFCDNLWPQVVAIIFPAIQNEFHTSKAVYLQLGQNIGLAIGAAGWGIGSDIIGRKKAFNMTLLITAVFGSLAAASPNFAAVATFAALWSSGVGGNLPVDSSVFLEFIPGSHQYLLMVMSGWWALGMIVASGVAWPLMSNYACDSPDSCSRSQNMGWRYFTASMGLLTLTLFLLRFVVFTLYESPKFLMGRGNDRQAIESIQAVAKFNGKTTTVSLEDLQRCDTLVGTDERYDTAGAAVKRTLGKFNLQHLRALFTTREMAFSTSLIILLWALILLVPLYSSFLPFFLNSRGAALGDSSTYITFRNYMIIAICGIPGTTLGALSIELPFLGRKGAMSISTILTGIFLFISTTARSSNALLAWNCGYAVTSGSMYGILYSYTPEIFPTKDRGTGTGLASTANRLAGIIAPIIAIYVDLNTSVPIYISAALFVLAGGLMVFLPYEPMGKMSL